MESTQQASSPVVPYLSFYWNNAAWENEEGDNGRSVLVELSYKELIDVITACDKTVPASISNATATHDEVTSFMVDNDLDSTGLFVTYAGSEAEVYMQELTVSPGYTVQR